MTYICVYCASCLGVGEVHITSGPEPCDGKQRPEDSHQIPAHPFQGSVSPEPTGAHQGTGIEYVAVRFDDSTSHNVKVNHNKHGFTDIYSSLFLITWTLSCPYYDYLKQY